ncbi:MAG: MarR family transcriptional regulator [Thiomonas sp.]|uniref:MarR family winged helix-turn-helix transcriptional regulator n=1 Tax=Thiomonas sp. TaxID=2047785 RepID=UPI002A3602A2|nr:MarR family transcriptional regulator [Thiomonas sp.]MDY0331568.1 MarR family transcriptional regulator [Thiomonas sp.]
MNSSAPTPPQSDAPRFYDGSEYVKDNSVGFLMKVALAVLVRNLEHQLQALELTGTQWHPLLHVHLGCDTVAACAREMQTDAGAMTRMLDRLEAKGLLVRERSSSDRRVVNLALTPRGAEVAAQIPHMLSEVLNEHLRGFSPEEFKQLLDLLRRFIANGEALGEANKAGPGPHLMVQERDPEQNDDSNPS